MALGFSKPNMTVIEEYFYNFDDTEDMLVQKTSDGTVAFTYPFDTVNSEVIRGAEWDGVNWWTLEDSSVADSIVIRRWQIDNYICKLQQTININAGGGHLYDVDCFTVEHYHTTITGSVHSPGSTTITMDAGYGDKVGSGMNVTLKNTNGDQETISVFDADDGSIELQDPTVYTYTNGDTCEWYSNIWLLNNYDGIDDISGALYKFNAYLGSYINHYAGGAYKDITCMTFSAIDLPTVGEVNSLIYIKYKNMLFVDISGIGVELDYYGSMVVEEDGGTITDLAMENDNLYMLQGGSYKLTTFHSFVTSIALLASPAIIAANGVSASTITAVVKDQFGAPVVGRLVDFEVPIGPGIGEITGGTPKNTDSDGRATTVYTAGDDAATVTVTATVSQT